MSTQQDTRTKIMEILGNAEDADAVIVLARRGSDWTVSWAGASLGDRLIAREAFSYTLRARRTDDG